MKPVNLYFAGAWASKCKKEATLGITNKLVSYMYPEQLESWLAVSGEAPGNIIIDSGAFSAWNKGSEVNLNQYIEYCKQAIHDAEKLNKKVFIVNLDVIPGKKGETASLNKIRKEDNLSVIDQAAKEGYRNLLRMKKGGINNTIIHVFHQGETWEHLERMCEKTNYIGISPANDMSVQSRKDWMRSVFDYMYYHNINVDTHGFAVWMPSVLKEFPFTSCDAATWRILAAWGGIYYPVGGYSNPDFSQNPHILHVSSKKSIKGMGIVTDQKMKMLEKDGYTYEALQSWELRAEINIRYFLGMQKWLNEYRATIEYEPRKSLVGFF